MPPFLTVNEAARLTGRSPSSIRRVLYPIIKGNDHPDRSHIQPSVEDVVALRMKGENFAWRLSEELMRRELPAEAASEKEAVPSGPRSSAHADGELLAMLRRELDIKNQQIIQQSELISKQMELVSGLSERLREGNILMGALQQRLALTNGRETNPAEPRKPKRTNAAPPVNGNNVASKTTKPKRTFFSRFFS